MCFSVPVDPVRLVDEQDYFRRFRPRPVMEKNKIMAYEFRQFDVYVTLTNDTTTGVRKMKEFAETILKEFRGAVYTDFSVVCAEPWQGNKIISSHPIRLVKNKTGLCWLETIPRDKQVGQELEVELRRSGYCKIHLVTHHGFSNQVIKEKN